ncbi:hypothetical protein [Corynebacterium argentoratense]|uniref:hypothetical protein n=1 Tax=Corynebacterium argentoratense TaxID=42817 RepID=UPI001F166287|nr:hypothetical protein [Corynebacterium argentoratense]MCF1712717.1 hypothetical protein [Corynebacterium argentoratense]
MSYLIDVAHLTLGVGIAYYAAGFEPRGTWDHRKRVGYIVASFMCITALVSIATEML